MNDACKDPGACDGGRARRAWRRSGGIIVGGLALVAGLVQPAVAFVSYQMFTDRAAFEAAAGGSVRVVDFDDLVTSKVDPVRFLANRYKSTLGIRIEGNDGQYASRDFGFPADFPPSSAPNSYAPGPIGQVVGEGGNRTELEFFAGLQPARVAGIGVVFIDADFPGDGPSSLAVFDLEGTEVANTGTVSGGTASHLFRGFVATDGGVPVPSIGSARIINGQGWPGVFDNEGVTLDDLVFTAPVVDPGNPGEVCDNCIDDDGDGLIDRLDPECPPPAVGGVGAGDATKGKAVVKCQKTTEKAAAKFAASKLASLQKCVQAFATCVQLQNGVQACLTKATATCDGAIGKIAAAEAKLTDAIGKGCGGFAEDDLKNATVLGYQAEANDCATLGVGALTTPTAVAQCVVRSHECAVERLLGLVVPRAAEFLTAAGHGSEFPCLDGSKLGGGQGFGAIKGKTLLKCDKAIQKTGGKLLGAIFKIEQQCADAAATCVHQKSGDQSCLPKASGKCSKGIAKAVDPSKGTLAKLLAATLKPCLDPSLSLLDLAGPFGLGYSAVDSRCSALGFPLTSGPALLQCLGAEVACQAQRMGDKQVPRLREWGADLDVVLPEASTTP
jgi:hypothetical protein